MALKAGYKGFKKLISPLKLFRPGELGIDQDALVEDLDPVFFTRSEQAVMGVVNLFYYTLSILKAINTAGTWSDNVYTWRNVQYTINADLSITAHKTGDISQESYINIAKYTQSDRMPYEGKNITMNGCPSGGGSSKYRIKFEYGNGTSHQFDNGGGVTFVADMPASGDQYVYCSVISITDDITFKPMARLASNPDSTFVPPDTMTNKELTDAVTLKNGLSSVSVIEGATLVTNDSFLRKQNNVISAQLRVNGVTANSGVDIATIPSGFIPSLTGGTVVFMSNASTGEMIPAYITINGYVRARTNLSSVDVNINFTYIAPSNIEANREANRAAAPEEADPEEAPATRSTKKSTKSTASADNNE